MPIPSDSEARREFLGGVRAEMPLLLGVVPFGLIFGVLGLAAGLPGWAVVLSSSLVFGGSSQVVFAQLWGAATPAPVFVWRPEATSGRVRTFIESLQDSGRVRTLDDAMAPFACTPLRETARISALVRERLAL